MSRLILTDLEAIHHPFACSISPSDQHINSFVRLSSRVITVRKLNAKLVNVCNQNYFLSVEKLLDNYTWL